MKPKNAIKWQPQLQNAIFTPWYTPPQGYEFFIPIMGMIGGKIYMVKHQIQDGKRKLELKEKINY